jgi:hypothetical protein
VSEDPARGSHDSMRAMFVTYIVLIVAGLTFFTIIGLAHH